MLGSVTSVAPLNGDGARTPRLASVGSARIRIHGLQRTFISGSKEVKALGPLDLEVTEGEFLCIVGPSGCGKSTLLRVLAGLIKPTAGRVEIRQDGTGHAPLAMVFQDHGVYPWKTVEDNIRLGLDLTRSVPRRERGHLVAAELDRLGLREVANSYPATLSGGMRQRVSIGRALVVKPEVLLMDEPFASLDAQLRTILQDEMVELWERDRRTVVFITHNIDEAIFLGDRVVVMSARPGRLCAEYQVPFERPRAQALRGAAEFAALHQEIWSVLRSEVDGQLGRAEASEGDDAI